MSSVVGTVQEAVHSASAVVANYRKLLDTRDGAGVSTPVIVSLDQTYITANYPETQLVNVQQGQKVLIKIKATPDYQKS